MTRAPANLLAVRRLLLDHLNVDPGTSRDQDLEPAEVGIVGDPAHRGGGHCGSDRVKRDQSGRITDYTVVESPRDRDGLTLDAAALDVGEFRVVSGGRTHDLRTFSTWCVAQCIAGTLDSRDIREIIYSPDGRVVRRWDRLRKRSSGDDSHLWHTHFTFFRDSIKAGRDQTPLFRRYLTTIGLLAGEDDDMSIAWTDSWPGRNGGRENFADRLAMAAHGAQETLAEVRSLRTAVTALAEARPGVDTATILTRMDALADEERQRDARAAAERAELAELVRQVDAGELDAAEVVRLIGERLIGATAPQG